MAANYVTPSQGQIDGQRMVVAYLAELFNTTPQAISTDLIEFGIIYLLALKDRKIRKELFKPNTVMKQSAEMVWSIYSRAKREHRYVAGDTISETLSRALTP